MRSGKGRRWSALAAVAAVLVLFALFGHALHEASEHGDEHAVHCAIAVCFVIATLLAPVAALAGSRPQAPWGARTIEPEGVDVPAASPPQARASPDWLQRFRN